MAGERYICADWGTSHLRATLCEYIAGESVIQGVRNGPGVKDAKGSIEETLFTTIRPWVDEHGTVPIFLAGMVGSNIGWRITPYLVCPLHPAEIAAQCTRFTARGHDIVMAPGLECMNGIGEYDLMRGEELQILGWLCAEPSRQSGECLVCLPGTHTKWVQIKDGQIASFQTAVTGELYSLLLQHSVLLAQDGDSATKPGFDPASFCQGVEVARKAKGAVLHALFSARSRLLKELISLNAAASYLSGLLIGADVSGALNLFSYSGGEVSLIGEPELCEKFSLALRQFDLVSKKMKGARASLRGFTVLYENLYQHKQCRSVPA